MSAIPPFTPVAGASARPRMASPFQHLYDQIDVLRRQMATAVTRGALTAEQATAIAGELGEIETSVEAAERDRGMTRGELRETAERLHDIRREIVRAGRAAAEAAAARHGQSAGDRPHSLDITV